MNSQAPSKARGKRPISPVASSVIDESAFEWPLDNPLSPRFLPPLTLAMIRSVTRAQPCDPDWAYYRALVTSAVSSILHRRVVNPAEAIGHPIWVHCDGCCWLVNRSTVFAYYLLPFEPETCRTLCASSGEVFVDVGANLGQYSLRLARRFRRVIAIEPNPEAAEILRANIDKNHIENIRVIEKAVSATGGKVRLYRAPYISTWSIVRPSPDPIWVDSITLSQLVDDVGEIDLMKVDVEDAEFEVLSAAPETLSRIPRLIVETIKPRVLRLLWASGFQLSVLGGWLHPWETIEAVRAAGGSSVRTLPVPAP